MRRSILFSLIFALPLWNSLVAQDAGMVLRTSVGYGTQRASLPLTDEQKKQADQFGQEARQENSAGRYGEAMRRYHEGMAAMHSVAWTPQVELASSLTGHLDHAMLEARKSVTISLTTLYSVDAAALAKDQVKVGLYLSLADRVRAPQGAAADTIPIHLTTSTTAIDAAHLPSTQQVTLPDLTTGNYNIEVRLTLADGSVPEG